MVGVILAAGRGTRLNGMAGDTPKCLVPVGGLSLLHRSLRMLRACGVDELAVVVGCGAEDVKRVSGPGVRFVENARFAQTNSMFSLWLAKPLLAGGFVVMNCDVLFHPQVLMDLLTARHEDALLLAYRDPDAAPFGDEEMKVRVRCGRVVEINKTMDPELADGENLGIAKFGPEGARVLIDEMDALVAAGEHKTWVPRAFQAFALRRPLYAVGTRGYPWTEIDFPEDYRRACEEVLPAIEALPMASHPFVRPAPQPVRTEIIARGA